MDSVRAALHESQFKIIPLYVVLGLDAARQFILYLKQAVFISVPTKDLSSDWLPLIDIRWVELLNMR